MKTLENFRFRGASLDLVAASRTPPLGRAKHSCRSVFEYLKKLPQLSVPLLAQDLKMTAPTARVSLNHLATLGIVKEISGKKRDKVYIYKQYLDILESGTEPL